MWARMTSVCALGLFVSGCGYGEVSPKAYEIAKALWSICERKDAERLDKVSELIAESEKAGEVTAEEAGWLRDIVEDGRDGDWDDAVEAAREMMSDQVKGGP